MPVNRAVDEGSVGLLSCPFIFMPRQEWVGAGTPVVLPVLLAGRCPCSGMVLSNGEQTIREPTWTMDGSYLSDGGWPAVLCINGGSAGIVTLGADAEYLGAIVVDWTASLCDRRVSR